MGMLRSLLGRVLFGSEPRIVRAINREWGWNLPESFPVAKKSRATQQVAYWKLCRTWVLVKAKEHIIMEIAVTFASRPNCEGPA